MINPGYNNHKNTEKEKHKNHLSSLLLVLLLHLLCKGFGPVGTTLSLTRLEFFNIWSQSFIFFILHSMLTTPTDISWLNLPLLCFELISLAKPSEPTVTRTRQARTNNFMEQYLLKNAKNNGRCIREVKKKKNKQVEVEVSNVSKRWQITKSPYSILIATKLHLYAFILLHREKERERDETF